jgi:thiazole synthase ThiGH ThiG subunit
MKTSLLSLFAGTVFLAGSAIASAGEPMALTSAELDAVTAGRIEQSNSASNYVRIDQYANARAESVFGDATAIAANSASVRITNNQSNEVEF